MDRFKGTIIDANVRAKIKPICIKTKNLSKHDIEQIQLDLIKVSFRRKKNFS